MQIVSLLLNEFNQEIPITERMLAAVPEGQDLDYRPHPKSMTMNQLTTHLADIASWPEKIIKVDEIDMAVTSMIPMNVSSASELLPLLHSDAAIGRAALEAATDDDLEQTWTLRYGDHIIMSVSKYDAIRHGFAQMIHHRAQLGVYLRLLNIPIPGSYGPSADEMGG